LREIDFIRAVSALAVIAIHTTGPYVYAASIPYYINQLSRFAVPMFIIISGLLLWNTSSNYKGIRGYFSFLGKRMKKIYIPYLVWSIIYILYKIRNELSSIFNEKGEFLIDTLNKLLYGTAYDHLYFVIIIIQLYLLYIPLRNSLNKLPGITLTVSFLITLAFQTGIYLQVLQLVKLPPSIIPYYIFFPTWLFYFVFGMYFAMNRDRWKAKLKAVCKGKGIQPGILQGIIVATWMVSLLVMVADNRYTKTFYSSIKPSIMLYSITTFFLLYAAAELFKYREWKVWKIPEWISVQSYNIYLSHLLVQNLIKDAIQRLGLGRFFNRAVKGMAVLYLVTVLFTCLFAYVVSYTPVAGILGGSPVSRNKYSKGLESGNVNKSNKINT